MAHLGPAFRYSLAVNRKRFASLWLATAWPYVVMVFCFLIARLVVDAYHDPNQPWDPVTLWHSMGVLAKIGVLLAYVVSISLPNGFAIAGAVMVIWADLQAEEIDLRSVSSRIGHIFWRLTGLSLCIGMLCSIASVFFYFPGVLVFAFFSFAIPMLIIEDVKVSAALRRGTSLASKRFAALLGLYAIVLLAYVAAAIVIVALLPAGSSSWTGIVIFWASFVAIVPIGVMVTTGVVVALYRDLRGQRLELAATPAA